MTWTAGIPHSDWDDTLFARGGAFTQSSHWAAAQAALGHEVFFAQDTDWRCLAILEHGRFDRRIYTPYGPHLRKPEALTSALAALRRLAIQHRAVLVRVEPTGNITPQHVAASGLKRAVHHVQPELTWIKDLAQTEDELLMEMTPTNRNLYRTAAKKGLRFTTSRNPKEMSIFLDMLHEVAARNNMRPRSDDKFITLATTLMQRDAALLYFALHEGKPVASALVYDSPTTRYYAHAASYIEARKLHPGSPLLSTMIFDAKKNGQKEFDFFGVAPPDQPNHKWAGFSRFKQSFGGEYKEFCGTWELPVKKFAYTKYRFLLKTHRLLR